MSFSLRVRLLLEEGTYKSRWPSINFIFSQCTVLFFLFPCYFYFYPFLSLSFILFYIRPSKLVPYNKRQDDNTIAVDELLNASRVVLRSTKSPDSQLSLALIGAPAAPRPTSHSSPLPLYLLSFCSLLRYTIALLYFALFVLLLYYYLHSLLYYMVQAKHLPLGNGALAMPPIISYASIRL